jgi:hypothetical protein
VNIFKAIKAAWSARKVVKDMGDIKRGWKTLNFWLTLVGNVIALSAAIKGFIPAVAALVVMTLLTALYNILRGAQKSQETGVRAFWKTSEFWLAVGAEISKAVLAVQQGGVNPAWLASLSTFMAAIMTIARDMAHKEPDQTTPTIEVK